MNFNSILIRLTLYKKARTNFCTHHNWVVSILLFHHLRHHIQRASASYRVTHGSRANMKMKFLTPTTTWLHFLNLSFYPAACRWLIFSFELTAPDTFLALYYFFFLPPRMLFWFSRLICVKNSLHSEWLGWTGEELLMKSQKADAQSTPKIIFESFVMAMDMEAYFHRY